jgi:MFS family permease
LSLLFLTAVLYAVIRGRLRTRYTLLWFAIGALALISPALYALCLYLHEAWSFPTPSILLLVLAVAMLALICLQLTVVVSRAWRERKNLAQHNALLEHRLEALENMLRKSD